MLAWCMSRLVFFFGGGDPYYHSEIGNQLQLLGAQLKNFDEFSWKFQDMSEMAKIHLIKFSHVSGSTFGNYSGFGIPQCLKLKS